MSYESYEERRYREKALAVRELRHKLKVAEAEMALAEAVLEADREGYAREDDD